MKTSQIKRSKILHPFLISIFPILILYSQNIGRINTADLVLPLILSIVFSIFLYYIVKIILKNSNKSAIIVSIILIILFSYGHIYYLLNDLTIDGFDIGRNRFLIPIFGISLGIGIFGIVKSKRIFDNATSILNVISAVFILVAVVNIGLVASEKINCDNCENELFYEQIDLSQYFEPHKFSIDENQALPDVYYLILDEYARNDSLLEYHDFDNSNFTQYLENKGFHVAKNSFSNYPMSVQSIPSTMNMVYVNFLADELGTESRNYQPLKGKDHGLYANNQVIKNFKDMGYKIVTFNTFSLYHHDIPLSDLSVCHRNVHLLDNELFDAFGRTSIFGYFIERWSEDELRQSTLCTFEQFPESGKKFDEPVFVWAHVMLPHPPWIFGPNGEEIIPGKPLLVTDNPEYRDSGWKPKTQYIQQVEFSNNKTIETIEKILQHNSNSIIIVHGDHGTAWDVNWYDPSDDDVYQRLRNFDAIYLPNTDKNYLNDDRILVNTFRIIFNSTFGSNYELLNEKLFWSTNKKPYSFNDVTQIIQEKNL